MDCPRNGRCWSWKKGNEHFSDGSKCEPFHRVTLTSVRRHSDMTTTLPLSILGVSAALSILCLAHLWRRPGRSGHRFFWSVVAVIPILGPLLYVSVRPTLPVQAEHLRSRTEDLNYISERRAVDSWRDLAETHDDGNGDA